MTTIQRDPFEKVPCVLCGQPGLSATKRCDRCWELETRIERDPVLAWRVLAGFVFRALKEAYGDRNPT